MRPRIAPLVRSGILLGAALAAFADGILLHQLLQWHHMVSSATQDAWRNTLADGLFHLGAAALAAAGVVAMWRAARQGDVHLGGRALAGSLLLGAGAFNVLEGLVNHQLLGLHHVHPSGALGWDLAFLALGAGLAVAGSVVLRSDPWFAERRAVRMAPA